MADLALRWSRMSEFLTFDVFSDEVISVKHLIAEKKATVGDQEFYEYLLYLQLPARGTRKPFIGSYGPC